MSSEMTASLRRRPSSPAAGPLEDEDLLAEILIRLPPLPSSLPRASAVCKRWRGLVSDPRFSRRYHIRHRRNPPFLGYFIRDGHYVRFQPIMEAPNRVPEDRFSFPIDDGDDFRPLGCRHGLMLILHSSRKQLLVWDPVTGDQHLLDIPPEFDRKTSISGAVLRASSGDVQHFQVVLVADNEDKHQRQAVASLYLSETGAWGDLISTPLPSEDPTSDVPTSVSIARPAVMAGGSLYWRLHGDFVGLLEFDLEKQCLAVIDVPVQVTDGPGNHYMWDIFADGGGLSFLYMSTFNLCAHLWKRETDCDGITSWVPGRTIDLVKLLSLKLNTYTLGGGLSFLKTLGFTRGFAEDNNVVLLWTINNVFTVQLETLQFKKLPESNSRYNYYPFEGVYTAETGIGGGHYGAELLHNAEDDLSG